MSEEMMEALSALLAAAAERLTSGPVVAAVPAESAPFVAALLRRAAMELAMRAGVWSQVTDSGADWLRLAQSQCGPELGLARLVMGGQSALGKVSS